MLDFLDFKTTYLIGHIFGAIIGAGGAFASDAMFFSTIKDGRITRQELRFMKLGGKLVWSGLALLIISGVLLVLTDPNRYLASDKFLAKLLIVGVIIINGLIFHLIHIPHIHDHLGLKFAESPTFIKKAPLLIASGAISMISWIFTVILGMLRNVPHSFFEIVGVYVLIVITAVSGAILIRKRLLHLS